MDSIYLIVACFNPVSNLPYLECTNCETPPSDIHLSSIASTVSHIPTDNGYAIQHEAMELRRNLSGCE